MEKKENLGLLSPKETMLRWNRYCDAHNRQGDCILLNEDRTYVEAFNDEQQAMKEILNSDELKRNEGFLVPRWKDDGSYEGMRYVPEDEIGMWIDMALVC